MKELSRWPLLLAAVLLAAAALTIDLTQTTGTAPSAVAALLALASAAFGAFLYAEGARHREWWDRAHRTDTGRHRGDAGPDDDP